MKSKKEERLSSTLMQCILTARLTKQRELRKHSLKLSPANTHRLSSSFNAGFMDARGKLGEHEKSVKPGSNLSNC